MEVRVFLCLFPILALFSVPHHSLFSICRFLILPFCIHSLPSSFLSSFVFPTFLSGCQDRLHDWQAPDAREMKHLSQQKYACEHTICESSFGIGTQGISMSSTPLREATPSSIGLGVTRDFLIGSITMGR
jgi:hypothetical protein